MIRSFFNFLWGIKSGVQFSDNPVTIVQQQKNWFFVDFSKTSTMAYRYRFFRLPFAGKIKNGISAGPKVVSEIPYTLQLNSKNSPKLKWLQVNELWSSFRYLAKTSLFLAFLKTEKNFLLNRKDFFSEINAKCPEKQLNLRLFPQRDREVRGSSIFASNNISLSTNFRKWEPKVNGSNVFTHCLRNAKVRGSNVITSRNYSPFHAFIDIVRSSLSWMVEKIEGNWYFSLYRI